MDVTMDVTREGQYMSATTLILLTRKFPDTLKRLAQLAA
jgi:hypothetical protein